MKTILFAVLAVVTIIATGCVKTVSDSNAFATTWGKDTVAGRYPRSLDQVYQASLEVIKVNGVLIKEYIPHDNTNAVKALEAKVNQRNVYISVESVDPKTTQVNVQARTKWGTRDLDLVHELEKQVALQLVR
jgi:hypothetical protein